MKRVYVVAWLCDAGSNFRWYHKEEIADEVYERESFVDKNRVYRFDAVVSSYNSAREEIDTHLDYFCEKQEGKK